MIYCFNYLIQLLKVIVDYYFKILVIPISDTLSISYGYIYLYISMISVFLFIVLHRFSTVGARYTRPRVQNVTHIERVDKAYVKK